MSRKILIDAAYPEEIRVATCSENKIEEYDYDTVTKQQLKGNLYLARITRIEPSLQAAFVEYMDGKHGFLSFSEIHPDYYIPLNEDGTMQNVPDDYNLKKMFEDKVFVSPNLHPEDEKPPESIPEIRAHNQVIDQPAPEIFDINEPILEVNQNTNEQTDTHGLADEPQELSEDIDITEESESAVVKKYNIQEVIKKGQVIIVQVIKEERGNKGASLTTYLSLAGRYCVLMPNSLRQGGISRRISNADDRKRIKDIIDSLGLPSGAGVIIRTAGADRSNAEIKRDYDYLVKLWNSIRETVTKAKIPAFIHAEGDVIKRCIRDNYDIDVSEIIIHGEQAYKAARDFMKVFMAEHVNKIKPYRGRLPIFVKFGIEDQISLMHESNIPLKSGGYLVINHTEALISVDVNSGKATSESNVEETALKTNLEAAVELAHQMKLRDLSGLIVVDFIDMLDVKNRTAVENTLRDALQYDKAKIHLSRISPLGLLEISRQRLKSNFLESNTVICSHCNGKGRIRAVENMAINIMRAIETELGKGSFDEINTYAAPEVIVYLLNHYREDVTKISQRTKTKINFQIDYIMRPDQYSIDKIRKSPLPAYGAQALTSISYKDSSESSTTGLGNKKNGKWKTKNTSNQASNIEDKHNLSTEQVHISNVDVIEQDNSKITKTGGYRKIKKNNKNNKKPYKHKNRDAAHEHNRPNEKKELVEAVSSGKKVKKEDSASSLLKGLWKKIID